MSNEAPNWFKEQYKDKVLHKYQSKGNLLRGTVMPEGTIEGSKVYFPVAGKGEARKKVRNQEAVPMNAGRSRVEAVLETWEAFDEVHVYDLSRMGINERDVIAETGAGALGRATDLEIIAKMNGAAATTGDGFLNGGTTDFNLAAAMEMCARLQEQDVPWDGNVFCPLPPKLWNQLLAFKQFNSSDYVGTEGLPLTKVTTAKSWNGVHWFLAPKSYFGVPEANKVDVFMYHRGAVGWGNNVTLETMWQWDNRKGCHTVRMEAEGCAAVPLPEGIIRGRFPTNGAITPN